MKRILLWFGVCAVVCGCGGPKPRPKSSIGTLLSRFSGFKTFEVLSPDFKDRGLLPAASQGPTGKAPELQWPGAPKEAKAFAICVENADIQSTRPFLFWMVANVPAGDKFQEGGIPGKNDAGTEGYSGPAPKPGEDYRYHFEVFALDRKLTLLPGFSRDELERAMKGHVLAQGELIARSTPLED